VVAGNIHEHSEYDAETGRLQQSRSNWPALGEAEIDTGDPVFETLS